MNQIGESLQFSCTQKFRRHECLLDGTIIFIVESLDYIWWINTIEHYLDFCTCAEVAALEEEGTFIRLHSIFAFSYYAASLNIYLVTRCLWFSKKKCPLLPFSRLWALPPQCLAARSCRHLCRFRAICLFAPFTRVDLTWWKWQADAIAGQLGRSKSRF